MSSAPLARSIRALALRGSQSIQIWRRLGGSDSLEEAGTHRQRDTEKLTTQFHPNPRLTAGGGMPRRCHFTKRCSCSTRYLARSIRASCSHGRRFIRKSVRVRAFSLREYEGREKIDANEISDTFLAWSYGRYAWLVQWSQAFDSNVGQPRKVAIKRIIFAKCSLVPAAGSPCRTSNP